MPAPEKMVYVDCETTALDGQVFELAWRVAGTQMAIQELVLPHTLEGADRIALEINGYWRRGIYGRDACSEGDLMEFASDVAGACVIGANPRFDAIHLVKVLGFEPWHYRLLDVEAYAAAVFFEDCPIGMTGIHERLMAAGFEIPTPDHTAAGDVLALEAAHLALREMARRQARPVQQ